MWWPNCIIWSSLANWDDKKYIFVDFRIVDLSQQNFLSERLEFESGIDSGSLLIINHLQIWIALTFSDPISSFNRKNERHSSLIRLVLCCDMQGYFKVSIGLGSKSIELVETWRHERSNIYCTNIYTHIYTNIYTNIYETSFCSCWAGIKKYIWIQCTFHKTCMLTSLIWQIYSSISGCWKQATRLSARKWISKDWNDPNLRGQRRVN